MERLSFDATKYQKSNTSSIESSGINTNITSSIELPQEIDDLIDNKNYRPRFLKLWRLHPQELLTWARAARRMATQESPSHLFAKGCKVTNWERTLKFVAKLRKVQQTAERVAAKIGSAVTGFIYKQVWHGVNVERWADMAREVGRHKARYFTWLCSRECGRAGKQPDRLHPILVQQSAQA